MSAAITSILIGVAGRVGAPIVKSLLEKHLGGVAGEIGGTIIDAIADSAGVTAEQLPELPAPQLEAAVKDIEDQAPEILVQWNLQQKQTHDLLRAEMDKGPLWTWLWRPAGMYLFGFYWTLYIFIYPCLNLFLRLFGASEQIQTIVDVATLVIISGGFMTLYMGGNTFLRGMDKWKAK